MSGKVNIRDLEKFKEQVEKSLSANKIDLFIQSCAKELTARLLARVIRRTPVGVKPDVDSDTLSEYWTGYIGGNLRRGWTGGTNQSASAYAQSLKVNHFGDTYVIEVINPVEYAAYVEYGHRQSVGRFVPALGKRLKAGWVEGKFMLTISEKEIRADAPRVLQNKLQKKLKEVFR